MPHQPSDESKLAPAGVLAKSILDGTLSLVEGARKLSRLALEYAPKPLDDDFSLFLTLDDRAEALPVGDVRQYWAPEAFQKTDAERLEIESLFREDALAACRSLVQRYPPQ